MSFRSYHCRQSRKRRRVRERQTGQTSQCSLVRSVPAGYLSGSEPPSDPGSDDSDTLLGVWSPSRFHAFENLVAPLAVEALGSGEPSSVPTAVPAEATWVEPVGNASWLVGARGWQGLSGVDGNPDHEGDRRSVRSGCPIHA